MVTPAAPRSRSSPAALTSMAVRVDPRALISDGAGRTNDRPGREKAGTQKLSALAGFPADGDAGDVQLDDPHRLPPDLNRAGAVHNYEDRNYG